MLNILTHISHFYNKNMKYYFLTIVLYFFRILLLSSILFISFT